MTSRSIILSFFLLFFVFSASSQSAVKKITKNELKQKMSGSSLQILDVRTPSEFSQGHIEGAVNISIADADFATKIEHFDKSKPIIVYCSGGARSGRGAEILHQSGLF